VTGDASKTSPRMAATAGSSNVKRTWGRMDFASRSQGSAAETHEAAADGAL
jgi:hypothetical protein